MVAPGKKFTLRHIFKNVTKWKTGEIFYSPDEEHFNVPWQMCIHRENGNMCVILCCLKVEEDRVPWKINFEYQLKIVNISGMSIVKAGNKICTEKRRFVRRQFISRNTLKSGYLVDDIITVEATVKITKVSKKQLRSFDKSNKKFSDVILAIEDEKFYVLKKFLASHSTYFKTLLLGKFEEAERQEVKLQDIDSTDFQNLMEVLYGESAIDDGTIKGILELADMYDMPFPIRKCEEFLIDSSEKSIKEKLKIAKQYKMENLKNSCLSKVNTVRDIKAAMTGDPTEMDLSVLAALLGKSLALH
ncbi:BTB domain-containing protein [Caenorhabditis elegans]|uniref:BTB domain-containing protein n=1 Tax=Caenorhabditis elegans TaxID=6239 RepID=O44817_CAEEL|nr:BTB domain-containing protein [Caenorhabditis elegans]CCD67521.1 BTB domain-containing protein [Caenorhabditis elegans]|eukprot:NP_494124.1 BTB and MATH domain containing [Caenorhabditis elegans]